MAVLTWQNVNAPDLSGAAQVIGQNGQNIGGAFNDLAAGLGAFNQARTDRADAAAIQAASQITDSAAYTQALRDGSILRNAGIDPNTISGRAAELLASRQKTLLGNDFDQAQIENQRADNDMALKRFEAEQAQAKIDNERSNYRFGREQASDTRADQLLADQDVGRQLLFTINQAGTDLAGARQMVANSNANDRVKQSVLGSLGLGGGVIKLSQPGAAGSRRTGASSYFGANSDDFVHPELDLATQNFGYAYDFGQQLKKATAGKIGKGNLGTSATGAYQFIGSTMQRLAEEEFGDNWREVPFTFENQSKLAERLFNESKGGNLKAVWEGLPDATPGAYKNLSFEEFQREVLPRESDMTLDEIRNQEAEVHQAQLVNRVNQSVAAADAIDKGMAGNAAQRLGNIDLNQFFKDSENKDPDLTKAAANATKEYPSLKGTELNMVARWLNQIQEKASATGTPLTAQQATHILGASMSPSGTISWHPFNGAESGLHFDEDKMEQVLIDVSQGGNLGRSIVSKQIASDREVYSSATAALAQATKDAQALREREAQGLPVAPDVRKRVQDAIDKALTKHESLTKKFSDPAYQQKLTESNAEVARKQAAEKSKVAQRFAPVPAGTAQGIGYAPSTAITSGLPNQAATFLEQRISR